MTNTKEKDQEYLSLKLENADKTHISFSEFSLFNQCGHRHLLEKHLAIIQQPPSIHLFFGNAMHSAIESGLKIFNIEKIVEAFRSKFTKDMMDNMKDTADFNNEFQHFLDQGENVLRILDINRIFQDYEIVAIEDSLYEHIYSKYFFKGFIDLVVRHKITKRYKIIDWKTSGALWDVPKKKKDQIFLSQMRFYKFFWARKSNVPLDEIDCEYVVLNRLKNKKNPLSFPGEIQEISIESTTDEIKSSLDKLAVTIKMIHIDKVFPKIKHTKVGNGGCIFCPLKGGKHPLCNASDKQYKNILKEYKKKK